MVLTFDDDDEIMKIETKKNNNKGMKVVVVPFFFPTTSRRKRTPRKRRSPSSSPNKIIKIPPFFYSRFDAKSKSFLLNKYTQQQTNGLYNTKKHHLPFKYDRHVYQKVISLLVSEERVLSDPSPSFVCSPCAPKLTAEVSGEQIMMPSHVAGGISVEGVPTECSYPASSKPQPRPNCKARKRKTEPKEDLSDPEVIVPLYHSRGQARRGRSSKNTSSSEEGKLDSKTFLHYFMRIWDDTPKEKVKYFTYFDPLWFHLYASGNDRPRVLNWMKKKGVFSKKYVLVPIVLWSHWSLLIFCNLGESLQSETEKPCLLLLDSLHSIGPTRLEQLIRSLVLDLYNMEDRLESKEQLKKIPLLIPKVPQQKKSEECGYYVLNYIHLFLKSAPESFDKFKGYPYFMTKDWFTNEGIESFYKMLESHKPILKECEDSVSTDSSDCVELIGTSSSEVQS